MAHADTVRAPVTKKVISGITSRLSGLVKAHPIGQIGGFGGSKKQQKVHRVQQMNPKHSSPISDYLGADTAKEDEYF